MPDGGRACLGNVFGDCLKVAWGGVVIIAKSGGDFTTIQAALDANPIVGTLFEVGPGTYTNDTVHLTANSQIVQGMGCSPKDTIVTQANANIFDYAAFTSCKICNIFAHVTAATSLVHTAQGAAGSCNFKRCHTKMTTAYATAGQAPCCYYSSGDGTVRVIEGTIDYNNTGATGGFFEVKSAIGWGANAPTITVEDAKFVNNTSGVIFAATTAFGTGAAVYTAKRNDVNVEDVGATVVAGGYLGGTGDVEFSYNLMHVTGTSTNAVGILVGSTPALRGMLNHIHVTGATNNYSYWFVGAATLASQFEDLVAANGIHNPGGATLKYVQSAADGDQSVSGSYFASKIRTTPEGGIAIALTNKTGANSIQGQVVMSDTANNNSVVTTPINAVNPIGVIYNAGIADAAEVWVVVSGIADVLIDAGGSTAGDWLGTSATAGSAVAQNSPPAAPTHFDEMGHCLETRVGAGLAKGVLHFN